MTTPDWLERALREHFANSEPSCTRAPELALLFTQELVEPEASTMRAHLADCGECQADWNELQQPLVLTEPAPVVSLRRFPKVVRWLGGTTLAMAASLLLWMAVPPQGSELASKGGWTLQMAAQRQGVSFRAHSGAKLQEGDQLGFFLTSGQAGYLTVLYATPGEPPERLFPARQLEAARMETGSQLPLSDGARLGAGTGCEWVIGLWSREPFDHQRATAVVQQMVAGRSGCQLAEDGEADIETQVITVQR